MAVNPMQRKARNSFLLGMLLMLVITGLIITLLFLQLKNYQDKEKQAKTDSVNICVLKTDVKSGQVVTSEMVTTKVIDKNLIPADAIGDVGKLESYALQDKEGNAIISKYQGSVQTLYINKDGRDQELKQEDSTGNYYYERNGDKTFVELNSLPIVAKVSMNKNTVITRELITKGDNTTANDIRKQEFNVVVLPSQIQTGDYIDIRLSMPTGEDYIVVAKKEVEIPEVSGMPSQDTVWVNLAEAEILAMSNAIVEAFYVDGAKLYATTYTEPGIQKAATPTYPVSGGIINLIRQNPNIVEQAKNELYNRYNEGQRVNVINSAINESGEQGKENLKSKIEESITNTKDNRKKYLDGLYGTGLE